MEHLSLKLRQQVWVLKEQDLDIALNLLFGGGAISEFLQNLDKVMKSRAAQSFHHHLDERHIVFQFHRAPPSFYPAFPEFQ